VRRQVDEETPEPLFGADTLSRFNIPKNRWRRFNGACPIILYKQQLRAAA
jgi:hypothetical protein